MPNVIYFLQYKLTIYLFIIYKIVKLDTIRQLPNKEDMITICIKTELLLFGLMVCRPETETIQFD